jgi:hypothetical protein
MIKLHLLFINAISAIELGIDLNNIVLIAAISFSFHFHCLFVLF